MMAHCLSQSSLLLSLSVSTLESPFHRKCFATTVTFAAPLTQSVKEPASSATTFEFSENTRSCNAMGFSFFPFPVELLDPFFSI